jgi:transcriptional regulator with XRE-family HTH domain
MSIVEAKAILGQNVRRIRESKGFSQEILAERSGFHRTYIGGIERGERNPSLKSIVAIATALEVPLVDLFEGINTEK